MDEALVFSSSSIFGRPASPRSPLTASLPYFGCKREDRVCWFPAGGRHLNLGAASFCSAFLLSSWLERSWSGVSTPPFTMLP